jgi:hypothetical protein
MPNPLLPRGIRNNNPGNLRNYWDLSLKFRTSNGFVVFESPTDGCKALAELCLHYYEKLGLTTVQDFISRYAPASENDVASYVLAMCQWMHINPMKRDTHDIRLDCTWNLLDWMRALIMVENGRPSSDRHSYPEWYDPDTLLDGIQAVDHWDDAAAPDAHDPDARPHNEG